MKKYIYLNITLIFILISSLKGWSQRKFVYVQDFKMAYKEDPNLSVLEKKFNLLYVLLLDSTYKHSFFKYDLEIKEEYDSYKLGAPNKQNLGFVVESKNIKEVLNSDVLKGKFFHCIFHQEELKY